MSYSPPTPQPSITYSYKSKFSAQTKTSVASKQGRSRQIVLKPNKTLDRKQWTQQSPCQYHSKVQLIYEELDMVYQVAQGLIEKTARRRVNKLIRNLMKLFLDQKSLAKYCFYLYEFDPLPQILTAKSLVIKHTLPSPHLFLGSLQAKLLAFTSFL